MEKYKYTLSKYTSPHIYNYGGQDDHIYSRWALCSCPNAKGEVKQLSGFDRCRETLCCRIFDAFDNRGHGLNGNSIKKKSIPIDKLRLVVKIGSNSNYSPTQAKRQKIMDKRTKSALHMLHIIEKEHKWGLTKAYPIKPYSYGDKIYMVVASKKWMRSPHMVSLFTLIFRISGDQAFQASSFMRLRSYKAIMRCLKEFGRNNDYSDKFKVHTSLKYWDPLLRNYNKMFRGYPMKDTFNRSNYISHSQEGINRLCANACTNSKLQERFNEVVKKAV